MTTRTSLSALARRPLYALLMVSICAVAYAQSVPQIDPGRIQTPAVPELRREQPSTSMPAVPNEAVPAEAEKLHFHVNRIDVVGSTVFSSAELEALTRPISGRESTLADLYQVATEITRKYRQAGYLLARAVVPAQDSADGVFHIKVVEGYADQVLIQGAHPALMDEYAGNIRSSRPLSAAVLERNLLLINDLPGYTVRSVIEPSTQNDGATRITLVVQQFKKIDGFVGIDNRQSRYFGPWEIYGGININDISGHGDRLSVRAGASLPVSKLRYGEVQYDAPLGHNGLLLSVQAGANKAEPGFVLSPYNVDAKGSSYSARLSYPLQRSRAGSINVSAALTGYDGQTVFLGERGLPPSSVDHIRAARISISDDFADDHGGRNLLKAEYSHGLDAFGASSDGRANPSRLDGQSNFQKLTFDAQRQQNLDAVAKGLAFYAALTAQTSLGDRLLLPEQFGAGGTFYGRGYDPSEITGDSGVAAKFELQWNKLMMLSGQSLPTQFYGFYDIGKVWNRPLAAYRSASLASTGLGARVYLGSALYFNLELARPLTRPVATEVLDGNSGDRTRVYGSVLWTY